MGTFGNGPFENDAALDLIAEVMEKDKPELLIKPLAKAVKAKKNAIEDWPAQEAIAAAELIAMLRGNPRTKPSGELREWIATTKCSASNASVQTAIRAVRRILNDSELADLVHEAGQKVGDRWTKEMADLIERLEKPAIPIKKKKVPEIAEFKGGRKAVALLKKKGFHFAGPAGKPTFAGGEGKSLSEADMSLLSELSSLRKLMIRKYRIGGAGWKRLESLDQLTEIDLSGAKGIEQGAAMFAGMLRLELIKATGSDFGDEAAKNIADSVRLKELVFDGTSVSDRGISSFKKLVDLERLHLSKTQVADDGPLTLGKIPALKWLFLTETGITSVGVKRLAASSSLERLVLDGTAIDDQAGAWFGQMRSLTFLSLDHTNVGAEACRKLAKSRSITFLSLDHTSVNRRGCRHLAEMPNLSTVCLRETEVTLQDAACLAGLPQLKHLALTQKEIREEDLETLSKFPSQVSFEFNATKISKACRKVFESAKYRLSGWGLEFRSGGTIEVIYEG